MRIALRSLSDLRLLVMRRRIACGEAFVGRFIDLVPSLGRIFHSLRPGVADLSDFAGANEWRGHALNMATELPGAT